MPMHNSSAAAVQFKREKICMKAVQKRKDMHKSSGCCSVQKKKKRLSLLTDQSGNKPM
jgi:hypothetical protein